MTRAELLALADAEHRELVAAVRGEMVPACPAFNGSRLAALERWVQSMPAPALPEERHARRRRPKPRRREAA